MPTVSPTATTLSVHSSKRFHWLLAALLLQLLVSPFLHGTMALILQDMLFLGILLAALGAAQQSRLHRVNCLLVGMCALTVVGKYGFGLDYLNMVGNGLGALVILLTTIAVSRSLARQRRVDLDTVLGGLCLYMFLGALWYLLYALVVHADPLAFDFTVHGRYIPVDEQDRLLFFFSYVTLLTTGYGDVIPMSSVTRTLAVLEGIAGQFYLVFFMARLVGLHIAEKER